MRLLFVEDNLRFRDAAIREHLSAHTVEAVSTCAEARAALTRGHYDAVLLDYDLPDGAGTDVVKEICACGLSGRIVAVSAVEANNRLLLAAGAAASVRKMQFGSIQDVLSRLCG